MSSSTTMRAACSTMPGFTPYSCSERILSPGAKRHSRNALGLRATSARAVIISATYSPSGPYSSHSTRNGQLVTPAIGESTTGVSTCTGPRSTGAMRTADVGFASVRGSTETVSSAHSITVSSDISGFPSPYSRRRDPDRTPAGLDPVISLSFERVRLSTARRLRPPSPARSRRRPAPWPRPGRHPRPWCRRWRPVPAGSARASRRRARPHTRPPCPG